MNYSVTVFSLSMASQVSFTVHDNKPSHVVLRERNSTQGVFELASENANDLNVQGDIEKNGVFFQ